MGRTSSLGSLGSKMQTGNDQLSLLTLCLGLIVINLMFWKFGRDEIPSRREKVQKGRKELKGGNNIAEDLRVIFGFSCTFGRNWVSFMLNNA